MFRDQEFFRIDWNEAPTGPIGVAMGIAGNVRKNLGDDPRRYGWCETADECDKMIDTMIADLQSIR